MSDQSGADSTRRDIIKGVAAAPFIVTWPRSKADAAGFGAEAWSGPIGQAAALLREDEWVEVSTDGLYDALTCANDDAQLSVAEYMDGMFAPPGMGSLVLAGGGRDVWDEGTKFVRYDDAIGQWLSVDYQGRFEGHTFAGGAIGVRRFYVALRDDLTGDGPVPRVVSWDLRRPISWYGDGSGYLNEPDLVNWQGPQDWAGYPCAAINYQDRSAIYVWQQKAGGLKRIDLRSGTETVVASDLPDCTLGPFEALMTYCPGMGAILFGGGAPREPFTDSVQMWAVRADGSYFRMPDVPIQRLTRVRGSSLGYQFGCRQDVTSDNLAYHPRTGMPMLWCRIDQRMLTYDGEAWVEIGNTANMPSAFRDDGVEFDADGGYWSARGQTSLIASIPALGVMAVVTTVGFEARLWLWRPPQLG